MSAHAPIVVTSAPVGRFLEGTIKGTPKPGQLMEIDPAVPMDARGRFAWRVYQPGTDGLRRPIVVLREAQLLGKLKTTAYADGDACWLYCPINGDEVQILMKNETGTGDSVSLGDMITFDSGTGKGVPVTAVEAIQCQAQEDIAGMTEDTHVLVMF